jgi:hypothetical protein
MGRGIGGYVLDGRMTLMLAVDLTLSTMLTYLIERETWSEDEMQRIGGGRGRCKLGCWRVRTMMAD